MPAIKKTKSPVLPTDSLVEHAAGPAALLGDRFQGMSFIDPSCGSLISSCLQHIANLAADEPRLLISADDNEDFWPEEDSWQADFKPYTVKDGVLMIPVKGALLNNFDFQVGDYATGYQYIEAAWDRGMADASVNKIALIVDSGGGQAAGNFELVDHMNETKTKPVKTFVTGRAYSGGYSISTVGDKIDAAKGAGVGSIGVVMTHIDYSKALDKQGIKVTFIYAGKHKVDGNSYEALSPDVKKRMQKSVDATMQTFVSTVANGRGMDEQAVRDTEADCFTATEGVEIGLVDNVVPFKNAIAAYRAGQSATKEGNTKMPISDEAHAAALAAADTDKKTAIANATKEATVAAVARIQSIMNSDEAKDKQSLASTLAYGSPVMSVDQAKTILKAAASEKAVVVDTTTTQQKANQEAFDKAVGSTAPGIKNVVKSDDDQVVEFEKLSADDKAKAIVGDYRAAGGAGLKKAS